MIQFNLLPDVKIAYLKTQRTKRTVILSSVIAAVVFLVILGLLFVSVQVVQKKTLKDVSKDIEKEMSALTATQDLDKILTIQNQLSSLPGLHDKKPIASRLFDYIVVVTPTNAKINKLDVDFSTNTISIAGTADSLSTINRFADSIKFATYKTASVSDVKPFSNVVTTPTLDATNKPSYIITFNFDVNLFSNTEQPTLSVPTIISNRSATEKPTNIFKDDTKK